MRSGTKNCYVDVQRAVESADPNTNAPVYTWPAWKSCFANATVKKGRDIEIDGQAVARSYVRFDFDYFDIVGITERDRIVYDGVTYAITGLLPDLATKDWFQVDAEATAVGTERT